MTAAVAVIHQSNMPGYNQSNSSLNLDELHTSRYCSFITLRLLDFAFDSFLGHFIHFLCLVRSFIFLLLFISLDHHERHQTRRFILARLPAVRITYRSAYTKSHPRTKFSGYVFFVLFWTSPC